MPDATNGAPPHPADDMGAIDGLVQLSFAVQEILQRAAAAHDLSLTQLRLLGILRDRTPTMAALAAYLRLDRSSISGLIDRAERRDLVRRVGATHDARVTYVEITYHGTRLGKEIAGEIAARVQELLTQLSDPQREALASIAITLTAAAEERHAR